MKSAIVYYSRAGENYVDGKIEVLNKGNTEKAAEVIHEITGAPAFKLEQEKPYEEEYNACIREAQEDLRNHRRPALKKMPPLSEDLEVLYLGYPNFWGTLPMAVLTFLEHYDWEGKTIRPFCTNEGSGLGRSLADIRAAAPKAVVAEGFSIHGGNIRKEEAERWCGQ